MIYKTNKSKSNLHLNALLEVMAELSLKCIIINEKGDERPTKEVVFELISLKHKMIEAFDNLFDSKEVTEETLRILFKTIMNISDDIHQVVVLLTFRDSI